jgi:hypothetical protein
MVLAVKGRLGKRQCKIVFQSYRGDVADAFLLIFGIGAAAQTQASLGSTVTLSGYSYTGTSVYLFLTGPNLSPDGVTLENINRPAGQGGATQVDVDADGHWIYKWNTANPGGSLDAGGIPSRSLTAS